MTDKLIRHNLVPNTPEWDAFRATHYGASEAAAMLGICPHMSRQELLRLKSLGVAVEVSDYVQKNIFDHGHEVEAMARKIVEEYLSDDLYPATISRGGKMSASCDGITLDASVLFEHKQWSNDLAESVKNGVVPEAHMPQVQQQLLLSGAKFCIFVVSDGTSDRKQQMLIFPSQEWFDRLTAGWAQFEEDLKNYVHVEQKEMPKATSSLGLPALIIRATGEITQSNLPDYRRRAEEYLTMVKGQIAEMKAIKNGATDLVRVDQLFADNAGAAKYCRQAIADLKAAKNCLAESPSVAEAKRVIEYLEKQFQAMALEAEKEHAEETRKRKEDIAKRAREDLAAYIATLEREINPIRLSFPPADFVGVMKNQKTFKSMAGKVDAALANAKIEAKKVAVQIGKNLYWFNDAAKNHKTSFPDLNNLIQRPLDEFCQIVNARIVMADQEAAARIAQEEQRKRDIEAAAQAIAQRDAGAIITAPHQVAVINDSGPEGICKKCGGPMRAGKAMAQTYTGVPDFFGDNHSVTISPGGGGKLIDCTKCENCGWSVTIGEAPSNPTAIKIPIKTKTPMTSDIVDAIVKSFFIDTQTAKEWIMRAAYELKIEEAAIEREAIINESLSGAR